MAKKSSIIVCILLLVYFMFTSGFLFEVSHSEMKGTIEMPYSMAFSGERLSIVGVFNDDDMACAEWLMDNYKGVPIQADYNGVRLLVGYAKETISYEPNGGHYLFLTSWNTKNGLMVVGTCPGLRQYSQLPDLDDAEEVFRRGDAVVYFAEES